MLLTLDKFGGILPRIIDPVLLPPNKAQVAENCRFDLGGLAPLQQDTFVLTPPNAGTPLSLYVYYNLGNRYFFVWPTDVDVVKAPIPNDSFNRVFFAENGVLKVTDNILFSQGGTAYPMTYRLPSPLAPVNAPFIFGTPVGTDPTLMESRAYLYTLVNSYGQEGPPSPVSNILAIYDGNLVTVIGMGSTGSDPNTKTLLHFDGDVIDSVLVPHTWTNNNVTFAAGAAGFGQKAVFNGINANLTTPAHADFNLSGGIWGIDFRITPPIGALSDRVIYHQQTDANNYIQIYMHTGPAPLYNKTLWLKIVKAGSTFLLLGSGVPITPNMHVAFVSNIIGGSPVMVRYYMFLNGSLVASLTSTSTSVPDNYTGLVYIGSDATISPPAKYFVGDIDEFCIRNGIAPWTAPFTPPSVPYSPYGDIVEIDPIYNVTKKRIYRLNQNASGAEYQFVAEIDPSETVLNDTIPDSSLGEVLPSIEWDGAPAGIKGIIPLPNGALAGFVDNLLCFSVPKYPHAWPVSYQKSTEKPIVGLGAFGTTVVVLTEGQPYLAVGNDPSNVVMEKVDPGFSCMSKKGIVQAGEVTIYPSPEGLSAIGPNVSEVVTFETITPDQWISKYNPSSIFGYYWQAKYIGFYQQGNIRAGFVFNLKTRELIDLDFYATAGYYDKADGTLYLVVDGDIVSFTTEYTNYRIYDYRSKRFRFPLTSLGVIHLLAQSYPVTLDVVYPKVPATPNLPSSTPPYIAKFSVSSRNPEILPPVGLVDECEVRIYGSVPITVLYLASVMGEIPI